MESPRPILVAAVGSVALVPVALFAIGRSEPMIALSMLCVLLITASLYLMFGPAESDAEPAPAAEPLSDRRG